MIAIVNKSDELVRLCDINNGESYGFHRRFGFVSDATAKERRKLGRRNLAGHPAALGLRDEWSFRFAKAANGFQAQEGCRIEKLSDERWRLSSEQGDFFILTTVPQTAIDVTAIEASRSRNFIPAGIVALLIAVVTGVVMFPSQHEETDAEKLEKALAEQKTIVVPKVTVVQPPKEVKQVANKSIQKNAKQTGAASQNLGFLKLLGKKELTKAVGGMPTAAPERSAGVGKGGTQGSGGELLTGLGQGIKKTTVGNTGVAGLGGIGNAGAGGGQGGFGTAYVSSGGSGGGKVLSEGELGKEMELDGGLDRVVIQATIAKYLNQVRACYEKGLRKNPGLAGQVLMDFEIAASGKLNYTKVRKTSLANQEVENCVATVMRNWQFPKPVGGTMVKVSYPFTFKPSNYM